MGNKNLKIDNKIKNFFDIAANTWDLSNCDEAGAYSIINLPLISESINGANILDVGCGTGVMEKPLLEKGANKITAIDISDKMIKIAKSKFDNKNIEFFCKDVFDVFNSFDVIVMYNVYPHLQNRDKLVEHVANLSNPGTRIIIAHGSGKDTINSHHKTHADNISIELKSADKESKIWESNFKIDTLIDKDDIYCISGILK